MGRNSLWLAKSCIGQQALAICHRRLVAWVVLLVGPRASRVELVVNFQHSFRKDMGIDLRGGDIGMTQHLLD